MRAHSALAAAYAPLPKVHASPVCASSRWRSTRASVRLNLEREKEESAKACAIAAISGDLASLPSFALDKTITTPAEWQYHLGMLAPELALFGAVYRCTVRYDDNDALKQGAVGAFAMCRALASTLLALVGGPASRSSRHT